MPQHFSKLLFSIDKQTYLAFCFVYHSLASFYRTVLFPFILLARSIQSLCIWNANGSCSPAPWYSPLADCELGPKITATPLSMRSHAESEEFFFSIFYVLRAFFIFIGELLKVRTVFLQNNASIFGLQAFYQRIKS